MDDGLVKCEVCGLYCKGFLNYSHLKNHGLTYWEYHEKYPNSVMRSPRWEEERGKEVQKGRWLEKSKEELEEILDKSLKSRDAANLHIDLTSKDSQEFIRSMGVGSGGMRKYYWDTLSEKEKETFLKSTFHSKESRRKAQKSIDERSEEYKAQLSRQISNSVKAYQAKLKPEEWEELNRKNSLGVRRFWETVDPEWKKSFLDSTINNPQTRKKVADAMRELWDSRSPEEIELLMKHLRTPAVHAQASASLKAYWTSHPEENAARVRRSYEANQRKPTEPEFWLQTYLDGRSPGLWLYNGDGRQCVSIGGKVPDFTPSDGSKRLIEEFGSYHHDPELFRCMTPEELVAFYKGYGYDCIVIQDWDCYLWSELDAIFDRAGW